MAAAEINVVDTSSRQMPITQLVESYDMFKEHSALRYALVWNGATPTNAVFDIDCVRGLLTAVSGAPLGNKLGNFRFFQSKVKLSVVVQGSPTAYGKLIIYADPFPFTATPPVGSMFGVPQQCRSQLVPHIVIDPSQSVTHELILDCNSQIGVYSSQVTTGSYRVGYTMINPIGNGAAGTLPDVRIQIYVSLVEPKLAVPTFTSETLHDREIKNPSDHVETFSKAMGSMSSIPVIGPITTVFSSVSAVAAKALKWFGFSKPLEMTKHATGRFYSMFEPRVFDGTFPGYSLGARLINSLGIGGNVPMYSEDDMVIETIAQKYGWVATVTLPTTLATGNTITTIPLTPQFCTQVSQPVVANGYEMTPYAFCTTPYMGIRNDFKVKLEFVGSVFHRATIVVAYFPNVSDTATLVSLANALQTVKTWTFQLSGNSFYELEIPWSQPYPYMDLSSGPQFGTALTTQNRTNGNLGFYMLNPVSSGGTGPYYMNIYYAGCNLRMGEPTEAFIASRYQPVLTSAPTSLVNPMCIPDPTFFKEYFGEEHAHTTKELSSRFSSQYTFTDTLSAKTSPGVILTLPTKPMVATAIALPTTINREFSLLDFICHSYVGYRGSMNFIVYYESFNRYVAGPVSEWTYGCNAYMFQSNAAISVVVPATSYAWNRTLVAPFASAFTAIQKFLAFTYPYYYRAKYDSCYPVNNTTSTTDDPDRTMMQIEVLFQDLTNPTVSSKAVFNIHHAGGDDFTLVQFRGTPTMAIT
jgi:hypothetical protein